MSNGFADSPVMLACVMRWDTACLLGRQLVRMPSVNCARRRYYECWTRQLVTATAILISVVTCSSTPGRPIRSNLVEIHARFCLWLTAIDSGRAGVVDRPRDLWSSGADARWHPSAWTIEPIAIYCASDSPMFLPAQPQDTSLGSVRSRDSGGHYRLGGSAVVSHSASSRQGA